MVLLIVLAGITIALVVTNENAETETQNVGYPTVVNQEVNLDTEETTVDTVEYIIENVGDTPDTTVVR